MDGTKKKTIIVKCVCVLLSFILWLYVSNVENPSRTSDLKSVPVEFLNEDVLTSSNLYFSPNQNYTVDLKLEGGAKEIYSVNKSDFILKADLSGYALKKGENNIPVEVVSAPEGVTIKNKTVLTVKVILEESTEKNVSVYSKVRTTFKDGVSKKSITVTPKSVKVSGPESLVENVTSVVLEGDIVDISKDISQSFKLIPIDSSGNEVTGVELSEDIGKVVVNVGNSKQVKINPVYKGSLPENLTLKGITLSADTVNILGDSNVVKSINQIDTQPINLSDIKESGTIDVKLNLPNGVSLVDNDNKVTASIEVAQKEDNIEDNVITKKIEGVKVNLTNKENTSLTYEANSITVEVSGKSSEINVLTAENVTATASVAGITEAGEQDVKLDVSLTNAGSSVNIISKPDNVKVVVK